VALETGNFLFLKLGVPVLLSFRNKDAHYSWPWALLLLVVDRMSEALAFEDGEFVSGSCDGSWEGPSLSTPETRAPGPSCGMPVDVVGGQSFFLKLTV
jgi:hypothetical protein